VFLVGLSRAGQGPANRNLTAHRSPIFLSFSSFARTRATAGRGEPPWSPNRRMTRRSQNWRGRTRGPRAPHQNHHHGLQPAPSTVKLAPKRCPVGQWREREKKIAHTARAHAPMYTEPRSRKPSGQEQSPPSRVSRVVFGPPDCAVCVRKPAACLRVRVLRSHGEVAVLREGAPEQGRVDQGGGRAAGGVHERHIIIRHVSFLLTVLVGVCLVFC
jgi:hypothetical protein